MLRPSSAAVAHQQALQWGRDRSIAEIGTDGDVWDIKCTALQWGRDRSIAEMPQRTPRARLRSRRFNGAAIDRSRKCRPTEHPEPPLARFNGAAIDGSRKSAGSIRGDPGGSSFNGAAIDRSRKSARRRATGEEETMRYASMGPRSIDRGNANGRLRRGTTL